MSAWFYFGCGQSGGAGHYLFPERGEIKDYKDPLIRRLENTFDGKLAPNPDHENNLYMARVMRIPELGYTSLSWWDRSVDKRGGSNSIVFAPSIDIGRDELLEEAKKKFPWVFKRTPRPVTLRTSLAAGKAEVL